MQHFELITDSEVKDAQRDLTDEITPQISELLKRAEQSLAKLERKQFALKSKVTASLSVTNFDCRRTYKVYVYHKSQRVRIGR